MATKSFLKEVVIRDSRLANQFVDALSKSAEKAAKGMHKQEPMELSRMNTELKGEDIKNFFGVK
ncbi:hypothetical protein [Anaerotignum lactatifermentans]|uniref:hypothetical protein n=1 Tax=Anaerotignum lactatifermentans TaxID=160404 RepID=UPI0026054956|nr:hypothetical protein [Anaerotignum lactatifermentans]